MERRPSRALPSQLLPARLQGAALFALALVASVAACVRFGALGDYPQFAQGAVDALSHDDLHGALTHPVLMGPLSVVVRAPAVAIARTLGADELVRYDAGAAVCLAAAALLAVVLTEPLRRRAAPALLLALIVVLAAFNPPAVAAVELGHPEELLTAALSIAAVALAARNRPLGAALALGLAIASKQWALLAVLPTLLALPKPARLRAAILAAAVVATFTLPFLLADPAGLLATFRHASNPDPGNIVTPASWLFALASAQHVRLILLGGHAVLQRTVYRLPGWLVGLSHAFIVVVGAALALLIGRARRGSSDPLLTLAILLLLRCVLDPIDIAYYNAPLVLALLAWETLSLRRALPIVTLLVSTACWLTFDIVAAHAPPLLASLAATGWSAALLIYLITHVRSSTVGRLAAGAERLAVAN